MSPKDEVKADCDQPLREFMEQLVARVENGEQGEGVVPWAVSELTTMAAEAEKEAQAAQQRHEARGAQEATVWNADAQRVVISLDDIEYEVAEIEYSGSDRTGGMKWTLHMLPNHPANCARGRHRWDDDVDYCPHCGYRR